MWATKAVPLDCALIGIHSYIYTFGRTYGITSALSLDGPGPLVSGGQLHAVCTVYTQIVSVYQTLGLRLYVLLTTRSTFSPDALPFSPDALPFSPDALVAGRICGSAKTWRTA